MALHRPHRRMGGMVNAIEAGYPQAEIADAAYEQQRELEAHEREIIGVTRFADPDEELRIPLLEISSEQERRHLDRLARVRSERDADAHAAAVRRLEQEARSGDVNLMPAIVQAVEAYATIGEMSCRRSLEPALRRRRPPSGVQRGCLVTQKSVAGRAGRRTEPAC